MNKKEDFRRCPRTRKPCEGCYDGCELDFDPPKPSGIHYIPQDDATRKAMPMARCLLDYFPAALGAVAAHAYAANLKHNPGQEPHWARDKSTDHADCIVRHLIERGGTDTIMVEVDGEMVPTELRHTAALAWRALALLQQELEDAGAKPGRASRFPEADTRQQDGGSVSNARYVSPFVQKI